ncbi:Detected protein of unknown function [Hibiscus syriacus]|uniref:Uncharacterized protein n=1 Tax=Hibiscus syriacus TaxID=106335 RepID=A0A6A3CFK4_HIBSY|nr:Detected protein of unknown function [Hibiscus syriacus]
MHGASLAMSKYPECSLIDEDGRHHYSIRDSRSSNIIYQRNEKSSVRKACYRSPSPRPPEQSATVSITSTMPKKELDKRTISPHRFPLLCTESVSSPTIPNTIRARQQHPSEPRRSTLMLL